MKTKKNTWNKLLFISLITIGIIGSVTFFTLFTYSTSQAMGIAKNFVNAIPDTAYKGKVTICTEFEDANTGENKRAKLTLVNNEVKKLIIDGKKIKPEDYHLYQSQIDDSKESLNNIKSALTKEELEEIRHSIKEATEELEKLDMAAIHKEIDDAMKNLSNIPMDVKEMHEALAVVDAIDIDEILDDVNDAVEVVNDFVIPGPVYIPNLPSFSAFPEDIMDSFDDIELHLNIDDDIEINSKSPEELEEILNQLEDEE